MKIILSPYAQKLPSGLSNAKNYPFFPEVLSYLKDHTIIQIGIRGEKQLVPDFRVNLSYKELLVLVKDCDFFISVDSFLPHLAKHVGKTGVVIWGKSDPIIFGYPENLNILKDRKYLRREQFKYWWEETFNPEVFLPAEKIYKLIKERFLL
jgi:ADP-heptose:LPS heptosyltransferase